MLSRWIAAGALALGLAASPAEALPTLNFDQGPGAGQAGGTLSYDGEGGPLVGTDIGFGFVTSAGTTLNPGVPLFCVPAWTLDFATGGTWTRPCPSGRAAPRCSGRGRAMAFFGSRAR